MTRSDRRPLRIAVVGSGPAGFYAAGALLADTRVGCEVDVLERLPTPWGLVRSGVAPDHPKIKSVSRVYEKIAAQPGFRFFGNVEVGRDLAHAELSAWYDAVIYAIGGAAARRAAIPGEEMRGSWSATEVVGWYNGHPDFRDLGLDLSSPRAVVVGNGNVALDVARMLCLPRDALAVTDVADHALDALAAGGVREVVVLGRRGAAQAAFTAPELRELGELDADIVVDAPDLETAAGSGGSEDRTLEILRTYARRPPASRRKRIVLRFLTSPVELLGAGRIEAVRVVRNELVRGPDGRLRARATGGTEILEAGLVVSAIGYSGVPVPGLPFDEGSGTIPNVRGRVHGVDRSYVAGWIKRGPSGVIGTNKKCATETVGTLLDDLIALGDRPGAVPSVEEVAVLLAERRARIVTYDEWKAIDRVERAAGEPQGRPRVKLTRLAQLLDAAH